MPSLKVIRTRIVSVKSTQKITRAMKLVSAARLRRAQDNILAARPYAKALGAAVTEIVARAGADAHPLMHVRPADRVAVLTLTSDRGLAGGFNANVFRAVVKFQAEGRGGKETSLLVVGRKGRDYYRRRRATIRQEWASPTGDTAANLAKELARTAVDAFESGAVDAVYLVFNEFKSAIQQRTVVEQLIPVPAPPAGAGEANPIDFIYEPSRDDVISTLIPLFIESQIYRALLESVASEFGARMTAMDSATTNARDMIGSLTLQYNRARQAAITKELMEIVGGAEALKG
ncbi:MAG TPA: ATP synthase F1 subunit gamma [Polyangia bacterium]